MESLNYVCIDTSYQMTHQPPIPPPMPPSMPPPINYTKIPELLVHYKKQIQPNCERVEYVFELFKQHSYDTVTDLERLLINFITWCNSSMVFEYTDTVSVRNLLANGVTHLNHEPIFRNNHRLFTDKGVNLYQFRKCAAKISKFRSEVYMSLFSDILKFEYDERVRYKKELFDAAQCGNYTEVHRIINNKHSSILESDIDKALKVAIWNEHNNVAQILIDYLNQRLSREMVSYFHVAVSHSNIECVRMFIMYRYVNIDLKIPIYSNRGRGRATALYVAMVNNDYSMVEELINLRADINSGCHPESWWFSLTSKSPLYFASKFGSSMDIVELLINSKASVDATDESLETPLYAASKAGHIEIVKRLLDAKSDFNATAMGSSPNTPLQIARVNGHDEILTLFR